ncbi:MAG TPA: 50S ribosomal protein L13 [Oscillospiraceae bacterium]|nr:50S ribosomal protein L13 [Oscillospiraceae bacterium]HPF57048.1 50S ribosomal protein L13 [Clostridiales bacterium]HPK35642.1 50S ribosomal protein L13 [Oscillospiraceae bacterium]HPR74705.1 50S ribosomal protein L13 [Oscillospiraceae bacterium]
MSTFMPKGNELAREWYVIDAAGKPLGRIAAQAAAVLRGKHKVIFTPHVDCGDNVIIVNAAKAVLTGNKAEKKYYQYHTGYIGHLKSIQYKTMMNNDPEKAMYLAIKRMLPANSIGRNSLSRLKVYAGAEHKHEAQKPKTLAYQD